MDPEKSQLNAYLAWKASQDARDEAGKTHDWSSVDVSSIKASDIGYEMGAALTEDQFKAYCAEKGINPKVIKKNVG